jgi:hypothetical protein
MNNVLTMSSADRIEEAMRRSLPLVLPELRGQIEAMLTKSSIGLIAVGLAAWAASHLFGAGEIMDAILLGLGVISLGMGAIDGGAELARFATTAINATSDRDLTLAGQHFAKAIDILGITVVTAVLMRQSAKTVFARGVPRLKPGLIKLTPPPPAGIKPTITWVAQAMFDNRGILQKGSCSVYGDIKIWLNMSLKEQQHVLLHELGHRIFTPKIGPLREFRASVSMSGYLRSAWLKYLEEALVEARASFIEQGAKDTLLSLYFPIKNGYVTISQLVEEGLAAYNIMLGGLRYGVYFNRALYSIEEVLCEDETESANTVNAK